jgi:hypothetical protein
LFVVEENLLAGRKDELGAAVDALDDSIREFHGRFPPKQGHTPEIGQAATSGPVPVPCFRVQQGPDRTKPAAPETFSPVVRETKEMQLDACSASNRFYRRGQVPLPLDLLGGSPQNLGEAGGTICTATFGRVRTA